MTNAERARGFYEAFNERGVEALDSVFDPDVVVVEPPELPDAATTLGIDSAHAGLAKFTSLFDDVVVTVEELVERDNRTLATIRVVATGKGSGAEVDVTRHDVATWRDGKVVRFEAYFDREPALAAFEGES